MQPPRAAKQFKVGAAQTKTEDLVKIRRSVQSASVQKRQAGGNYSVHRPAMMQIMISTLMKTAQTTGVAQVKLFREMAAAFEENFGPGELRRPVNAFRDLYHRVEKTGSLHDLPRSGRPSSVSDREVELCVAAFKRGLGNPQTNEWIGFTSIEHAAICCPTIIQTLEATGVTIRTLWNNMNRTQLKLHGKPFKKIVIGIKPKLTAKVRAQRLERAKEWASWDIDKLKRLVFIDEKQEYYRISHYECYADDDAESRTVESSTTLGEAAKKIKYIAAVNAVMGPVYFSMISGTSDYDTEFMVRIITSMRVTSRDKCSNAQIRA
jgi:hypothetical protein